MEILPINWMKDRIDVWEGISNDSSDYSYENAQIDLLLDIRDLLLKLNGVKEKYKK